MIHGIRLGPGLKQMRHDTGGVLVFQMDDRFVQWLTAEVIREIDFCPCINELLHKIKLSQRRG